MLKHRKEIDAVIAAGVYGEGASPSTDPAPLRDQLYDLIEAMPAEAQMELLALMWTGGPKNQSSFEENLALAQKTRDENHAEHLAEQGENLSSFLKQGLQKLEAP